MIRVIEVCMQVPATTDPPRLPGRYAETRGYAPDATSRRTHREIDPGDAGKAAPEKPETAIRRPIKIRAGQIRAGNDRTISA